MEKSWQEQEVSVNGVMVEFPVGGNGAHLKVNYLHERCGVGHLLMMNQAGFVTAEETRRSIELFAKEVYPAYCAV